ncbi:MAG: DegT/DnrJ/EryC1/StrS family aminotransferase [Chitinispirillales bacterium]|jgi:dTDP-4-amino-4,6-dideoxygalactose transaminase|nr:DegT/DnrJ/EryC1/StrS family aminotransferase [Chitinispirillales bacterium]
MNKVPFLDLSALHSGLEDEFTEVFRGSMRNAQFIGGPLVEQFETEFAHLCGCRHAVGVGSGTDALRFALIACGITEGDMVITVPNTFIATSEAISQAGAIPVFVDVDERTSAISVDRLREYLETHCCIDEISGTTFNKITHKPVRAVIPVHLYGQVADMDPIMELARRYKLIVIEDACQAHGAEYFSQKNQTWMRAGSIGQAAAFSFYPGKNLGAFGEAGAVTTNDEKVARAIATLRDHGQISKYIHDIEGYNGRLDALQAGILLVKLSHLTKWNEMRRQCAKRYNTLLEKVSGVGLPHEPIWARSVYHLYVIHVDDRNALQKFLDDKGIGTGLHYPVPLHLQKAYSSHGYKEGSFPVSERLCSHLLSLPMFPGLNEQQQDLVVNAIQEYMLESERSGGGHHSKTSPWD